MNVKNIKKEYSNDDVVVVWESGKCIHAAECVKNAGKVFKPKDKPWVQMENGTSEEIMAAIDKCPSGALSYYKK